MILMDMYGRTPSGERLIPHFHLDALGCQGQIKAAALYSHYYNIPSFYLELPLSPEQSDYLVSQLYDAIEWMERVTGKEYNDELLIEAVYNEWRTRVRFGRIIEFQKTIPAPLTQKNLASFAVLLWRAAGYRREVSDFFQLALDEVRERAQNQIAALSTERFRLIHEGPNTWYPSTVFKYPQKYGAIYIGSWLYFTEFGAFSVREDGSFYVPRTPEERGIQLKTREDALQSLAELFLNCNQRFLVEERVEQRLKLAEDWHADGVVFALDRGCPGNTCASMETILAMKQKGIPVLTYDTACANPGEFAEAEYQSRMDAFLESLGLGVLEVEKGG
jgi:benzoyl-CoA reductase subunit B